MSYPTLEEYSQALQSPQYAFLDPELKRGTVKKSGLGIPLALCGGFALTFKVTCSNNVYAVRCFHKESKDIERRYDAISRKLGSLHSPYFVDFHFIRNGVKANGNVAPIVKMQWSEGETLGDFVYDNHGDKNKISTLHREIVKLSNYLEYQNIAHGDIQPGNLMIGGSGSDIKLIDYDGMYVDELRSIQSSESGLKSFQHPMRSNQWNARLDRFSFILLDLVFDLIEYNPSLWNETQSHQEMFIFSANDLADPLHSPIIQKVKEYSKLSRKVNDFISICRCKFDDIPSLREFISGNVVTVGHISSTDASTVRTYINSYPVLDASDFDKCYTYVGQKVELIGRVFDIRRAKTVKGDDYVFVNFSDWRGRAVKLNIWKDGLDNVSDVVDNLHKSEWLSVNGLMDAPFSKEYYDTNDRSKKTYTHLSVTINHPSQITLISPQDAKFRLKNFKYEDPSQTSYDDESFCDPVPLRPQPVSRASSNNSVLEQIHNRTHSFQKSRQSTDTGSLNQSLRGSQPAKKPQVNNKEILANIRNISSNRPSSQSSGQYACSSPSTSASSEKEEKSGGCFITSAVCAVLGKTDDCIELNAFRKFRDEARETSKQISVLIDEYYRVAPLVIANIEKEGDGIETYKQIWDNHISKIYGLLEKGDHEAVTLGYIDLTVGLCDEYGISLSREAEEIVSSLSSRRRVW